MKPSPNLFDYDENEHIRKLRKKRIISFICVFLFIAIAFGIYFTYQYLFIKNLEQYISSTKQPENVIFTAFQKYKSFYAKQPNITGISFKTILKRHFCMDLPPVKKAQKEILVRLNEELIPERFPASMEEYRISKEKEAQLLYPLAKIGDKVKIRSVRGNYTGIFNGMGSKGASVRINQKNFSMIDLTKESKALFDPELNTTVQREYVVRECDNYRRRIKQFALSFLKRELRKQGYFYHGKFYSPSEYFAALNSGKIISPPQTSSKNQLFFKKAQEAELIKLSPMHCKYILPPTYNSTGASKKSLKTIRQTEDSAGSSAASTQKTKKNESSGGFSIMSSKKFLEQ